MCSILVSNQFVLASVVKDGKRNLEFKLLADWCLDNATPGEKILTTMPNVVKIFALEFKDSLVHTGSIKAESPQDFARKCFEEDITYVAWDSRMGLHFTSHYHTSWGLKNIQILQKPASIGPYKFITTLRVNEMRFINIFRLKTPQPES